MSVAAILIATATGVDGGPLALLPWDTDTSLVEHAVAVLGLVGIRDIEVVLRDDHASSIIPLLAMDGVEPVIAAGTDAAAALRAGASAVPRGTAAAIVTHVDEPRPAAVYAHLLESVAAGADIARASYGGATGTPVAFGADLLAVLRNLADPRGIPAFLERWRERTVDVPFDSEVVLRRASSAADLSELRAMFED